MLGQRSATMAALERWQRPFLTAYSDLDPGTGHFGHEPHGEQLAASLSCLVVMPAEDSG
jgi:hypothetical protein